MHNLKEIRKNIELFKKKIKERNALIDFDSLIQKDKDNRDLIQKKEKLEQEKKLLSKKKDPENFTQSKKLTDEIKSLEILQKKLDDEIKVILSSIPNLALDEVPLGTDDKSNIIIKNLNPKKRPISAVADNIEFRNAKKISIKTLNRIQFKLLYDSNRSLQKKIKIEQLRKETI